MPNGKYFGGAPNAFAGGMEFQAAQRQRQFQDNALRALIERFGPEAALPQAQAQLQTTQQAGQMHPYQMRSVQRQDAAHQANVDRFGPVAGSPDAYRVQQQEQQHQYTAAMGAGRMLQHVLQQEGDIGSAIDHLTPFLTASGLLPPENIAELRSIMESNPEEAVPAFMAMLQGTQVGQTGDGSGRMLGQGLPFKDAEGNVRFFQFDAQGNPTEPLPGFTPVSVDQAQQRIEQRTRAQDFAEDESGMPSREPGVVRRVDPYSGEIWSEITPGSPAAFNRMKQIEEMQSDGRNSIYTIQFRIDQSGTVNMLGDSALEILADRDKYDAIRAPIRVAQSKWPGTDMYRLQDYFNDIKSNIGIDELIAIKRDNAGLGHIPMKQLESLQRMLGDLHVGRDFNDLHKYLSNIMRIYQDLIDGGTEDIERIRERMDWLQGEWGNVTGRPGGSTQPGDRQQPAPPPGIAAPPGQGTTGQAPPPSGPAQARAAELAQQGMSRAAIEAQLRREGLFR